MASDKHQRLHKDVTKPTDHRRPGQRDYDRIIYSSAFLRLAGVTQVVHVSDGCVVHNRLTHSLKVARIGRGLAERLVVEQKEAAEAVNLDPDCVECAALAHDIGHPPFGHLAEVLLNKLITDADDPEGFEGNAQSFRVVTKLCTRREAHQGLNLTRGTLNGLLKYPWMRRSKDDKKWGAYTTESNDFKFARDGERREMRSIEAEVMDFADDVAYSTHDIEDYYRAGLLPLDRLMTDTKEVERFLTSTFKRWKGRKKAEGSDKEFTAAFEGTIGMVRSFFPPDLMEPYAGTKRQRAAIHSVTSNLIGRYFDGVKITPGGKKSVFAVPKETRQQIDILKELMWHYVILNPALAEQEYGQREVIEHLFECFGNEAKSNNLSIFSRRYREQIEEVKRDVAYAEQQKPLTRIVADVIAEMTEHHAYELHARLTGHKPTTLLDLAQR